MTFYKKNALVMLEQGKITELAALGKDAVEPLVEVFNDTTIAPELRNLAITVLGEMGTEGMLRLMHESRWFSGKHFRDAKDELARQRPEITIRILEDREMGVISRMIAAAILGWEKIALGVPALIRVLTEEHLWSPAMDALGRIKDPRALPHLERLLSNEDEFCQNALNTIRTFGEAALPVYLRNIFNKDEWVRKNCIDELECLLSKEANEYFQLIVRQNDNFAANLGLGRTREILTSFVNLFKENGDAAGLAMATERCSKFYREVYERVNGGKKPVKLGDRLEGRLKPPIRKVYREVRRVYA